MRCDTTSRVVAAYFLGRSIELPPLRRLVLVTAAAVAVLGIVEIYTVPIGRWEDADVPAYFHEQLGFDHHGPRGLPENFVFNIGENDLLRRAVSTFLTPLGTAYLLVVALCFWAVRPRDDWPLAAIAAVGLLFTFTRAALLVLAGALLVIAFVQRRWWPVAAAFLSLAIAVVWTQVYPSIAPETTWSQADLRYQRERAKTLGGPRARRSRSTSRRFAATCVRSVTVSRRWSSIRRATASATRARRRCAATSR